MTRLAAELERVGWSLDDLLLRPAWHAQAACRGASPALFFGKASQGVGKVYEVTRAAYCAACPVVAECAAAGAHEEHGLWGGMSVRERAEARRAARVVPVVSAGLVTSSARDSSELEPLPAERRPGRGGGAGARLGPRGARGA